MGSNSERPQLTKLAALPDLYSISQVRFAHDPVPHLPLYVNSKDISFPKNALSRSRQFKDNGIRLRPREAALPYRSTLDAVHESRFWKEGLEVSFELLQLLADDHSATEIKLGKGLTMSKLAQRELRPEFEHRFCKATSYMYPFADENRSRLLAASMVMLFLFDGKTWPLSLTFSDNMIKACRWRRRDVRQYCE